MPPRGWNRFCGREDAWEHMYGTTASGNLPRWDKDNHVGNSWVPCPYSTQASNIRKRHLFGLSDIAAVPIGVDHTEDDRIHYMRPINKGSVWGYECTFDNCPYHIENGQRYFYS